MWMGCPDLSRPTFSNIMAVLEIPANWVRGFSAVTVSPVLHDKFAFFFCTLCTEMSFSPRFECVTKNVSKLPKKTGWSKEYDCQV